MSAWAWAPCPRCGTLVQARRAAGVDAVEARGCPHLLSVTDWGGGLTARFRMEAEPMPGDGAVRGAVMVGGSA